LRRRRPDRGRGERGRHADAGRAADPQPTRSSVVNHASGDAVHRVWQVARCRYSRRRWASVSPPRWRSRWLTAGGVGSITAHLDQPVLAAGGIGDGRAFAEVLAAARPAPGRDPFRCHQRVRRHPAYKQPSPVPTAAHGDHRCLLGLPDCARPSARPGLRSCIDALGDLAGDTVVKRRSAVSASPAQRPRAPAWCDSHRHISASPCTRRVRRGCPRRRTGGGGRQILVRNRRRSPAEGGSR